MARAIPAGAARTGLVNRSQEMKRFFIARALGTQGELPRAAQSRRAARDQATGIRSIFAAQMKSFSDSPLIAWVVNFTRQ